MVSNPVGREKQRSLVCPLAKDYDLTEAHVCGAVARDSVQCCSASLLGKKVNTRWKKFSGKWNQTWLPLTIVLQISTACPRASATWALVKSQASALTDCSAQGCQGWLRFYSKIFNSNRAFSLLTFLVRGLWEAISWDGGADDLKHHITLIQAVLGWLREQRDDLVELIEGAGPAMDQQQRSNNSTMRNRGWLHMDKMDINPCHISKKEKLKICNHHSFCSAFC